MGTKGFEERLSEVEEPAMAFGVARRAAKNLQGSGQGWLRTVRCAVGVSAAEVAGRMKVGKSELYRMESAEKLGAIELKTMRKAAEALGCDLVYGLAPKQGTLTQMAAAVEADRERRRLESYARKLEKAKDKRIEAARKRWLVKQRGLSEKGLREYWEKWQRTISPSSRREIPKPRAETPFWRGLMVKSLRKVLRDEGIRLR